MRMVIELELRKGMEDHLFIYLFIFVFDGVSLVY